jgi:hypothetical protein
LVLTGFIKVATTAVLFNKAEENAVPSKVLMYPCFLEPVKSTFDKRVSKLVRSKAKEQTTKSISVTKPGLTALCKSSSLEINDKPKQVKQAAPNTRSGTF